jgi:hypothetical protein
MWFWLAWACFWHASTSLRGRIFVSGKIRAGLRLKRFLCFVLTDISCFRLPAKMSSHTGGSTRTGDWKPIFQTTVFFPLCNVLFQRIYKSLKLGHDSIPTHPFHYLLLCKHDAQYSKLLKAALLTPRVFLCGKIVSAAARRRNDIVRQSIATCCSDCLVSTIEELLGRKSSCSGLENREWGRGDPSRWPRDTLYPQKLALTSPTSGGRSVGIVRSRTQATEFSGSGTGSTQPREYNLGATW